MAKFCGARVWRSGAIAAIVALFGAGHDAALQIETLQLHVENLAEQPVPNVVLYTKGAGGVTNATDNSGNTSIQFSGDRANKQPYKLSIGLRSPDGWRIVAPPRAEVPIPWTRTGTEAFETVIIARKGDRALLDSPRFLGSFAEEALATAAPRVIDVSPPTISAAIEALSDDYGWSADESRRALNVWRRGTTDVRSATVAALTAGDSDAALLLAKRLVEPDVSISRSNEVRAESFALLGWVETLRGDNTSAAQTWTRATAFNPYETDYLNSLGLALNAIGARRQAEAAFLAAATQLMPVARIQTAAAEASYNAAVTLKETGNYTAALPQFRNAVEALSASSSTDTRLIREATEQVSALQEIENGPASQLSKVPLYHAVNYVALALAGLVVWKLLHTEVSPISAIGRAHQFWRSQPYAMRLSQVMLPFAIVVASTWWLQTRNPVPLSPTYTVRVHPVLPSGESATDVEYWTSLGGDTKQFSGNGALLLPVAEDSPRSVMLYAKSMATGSIGRAELAFAADREIDAAITLTTGELVAVRGEVVSDQGAPLAGVLLQVVGAWHVTATSDASGGFAFRVSEETTRPMLVHAQKEGYQPALEVVVGASERPVRLVLQPDSRRGQPPQKPPPVVSPPTGAPNAAGSLEEVFFAYNSSALSASVQNTLVRYAAAIGSGNGGRIALEGHCDTRGTDEYNASLGRERAQAVRTFLVNLGLNPARLIVVSRGRSRPVCEAADDACHARNRRVQFVRQTGES